MRFAPSFSFFTGSDAGIIPIFAQIPNGVIWLDASDTSTVHVDGSGVYQWDNKFVAEDPVTQTNNSYKPGYTTGVSVDFTAANSHHLLGDSFATYQSGSDLPLTVIAVYECTVTGTVQTLFAFGSSTDNDPLHLVYTDHSATDEIYGIRRDNTGSTPTAVTHSTVSSGLLEDSFSGTSRTVTINGVSDTESQNVGTLTTNKFAIGALVRATIAAPLEGKVKEFLMYNRELSSDELSLIRKVLNTKWSVY